MGLFQRLFTFSLGGKSKKNKQKQKNSVKPVLHASQSASNLLTTTYSNQDQQAAVNRLLRSSSTHFSILSETEYHSLPPIPHPINNLLREPSIISTQTTNTVNTYTVTVHSRTVHSCTEFPNANGTTSLLPTPLNSPRKSSLPLPPLTPGDKNRLENLKQDPSVLDLLNIFDETGHPNPKAFANTPARRRRVSTFKMLLGEQEDVEEGSVELPEESDLSWAERCLQRAERGSLGASSLGMADTLFKDDLSDSDMRGSDDPNTSITSQSSSIVDSLEVELGTAEDGSMVIHPSKPIHKIDSLLRLLSKEDEPNEVKEQQAPLQPISLKLSTALQTVPQAPRGPRAMGEAEAMPLPRLTMRNGPQQKQSQLSPPPRRHQPPPLPPIPPDFQFRSSRLAKGNPLGYRAPYDGLRNRGPGVGIIPSGTTDRSVSVASSVYPQIEIMPPPPLPPLPPIPPLPSSSSQNQLGCDPYTPIPRRPMEGKCKPKDILTADENAPPGAPLRPTKSQVRRFLKEPDKGRKDGKLRTTRLTTKGSEEIETEASDHLKVNNEDIAPRTPKKTLISTLQASERPSPASSSELSPEGRRIMDTLRAQARSPGRTPRKWNPLADNLNTLTMVLS